MSRTWAERTVTRVLNAVPGYSGYRDKETRREADRAVRERLAADLASSADRVERVAGTLADARRIREVGPVNGLATSIRHLRDRITLASYGYGGLFSTRDVNAEVLDQIRLFDESLFAGAEQISAAVAQLEVASRADSDLIAALSAGEQAVDAASRGFDQRSSVIETAAPASSVQMDNILAVLESPERRLAAASPPDAFELHDRDALAVQGDNFVVDARIDVETAGSSFRLFRLDVAPEKWLFVPKARDQPFAMFGVTTSRYLPGPPPVLDSEPLTVESSGHGTGEAIGEGGQSGQRAVAYTLLRGEQDSKKRVLVLNWSAERQVLTGADVHPDDVEIFGKPS